MHSITYTMHVDHSDETGRGTLCSKPFPIIEKELAAVTTDVFRWLDWTVPALVID